MVWPWPSSVISRDFQHGLMDKISRFSWTSNLEEFEFGFSIVQECFDLRCWCHSCGMCTHNFLFFCIFKKYSKINIQRDSASVLFVFFSAQTQAEWEWMMRWGTSSILNWFSLSFARKNFWRRKTRIHTLKHSHYQFWGILHTVLSDQGTSEHTTYFFWKYVKIWTFPLLRPR